MAYQAEGLGGWYSIAQTKRHGASVGVLGVGTHPLGWVLQPPRKKQTIREKQTP
jgi:hypothetical protein